MNSSILLKTGTLIISTFLIGCATESHRALEVEKSASAVTATTYRGVKKPIMVGQFDNRSSFMRGVFTDGPDRLGSQAKTILMAHLQQTGRFSVLDRDNMGDIAKEANFSGKKQKIKGADYTITGDVAEFGRKEVGDRQLFGIVGSGKQQMHIQKLLLTLWM